MTEEIFIPHNNNELYEKMILERFMGQLSLDETWLVWRLPNGIAVKVTFHSLLPETYLSTSYLNGKKEIALAHWHPYIEEVYRDLSDINSGQIFWAKKKRKTGPFFGEDFPIMMDKNEWEQYSDIGNCESLN